MKRVVMVAYAFPPEGNAGTYRPLRFARHLPAMGWQASVITLDTNRYERYDPGLLALVPSQTEVIRVRARDIWQDVQAWRARQFPDALERKSTKSAAGIRGYHNGIFRSLLTRVARRAEASCYHPDMAMTWIRPAVKAVLKTVVQNYPQVIWATGGPWSSFIVAQRAARQTGLPYVLDFRDPWTLTLSEFEVRRPKWAQWRDRHTLRKLFEKASQVIFRSETEAECYWRAYGDALDLSKIHLIPNGYEGPIEKTEPIQGSKLTILYTGTISSYRYDTLLKALHDFKESVPDLAKRVRFVFVGEGMDALVNAAQDLHVADVVETHAQTSSSEIKNLQREASALLVLGRPPTIRGYELLAGAKLFEYLRAGRPIIGILPSDETRKILCRIGVSTIADIESPMEIVSVLKRVLAAWEMKSLQLLVPDAVACEAYSAPRQTAALARALDGSPATDFFVPGQVELPPSLRNDIGETGWIGNGPFVWGT